MTAPVAPLAAIALGGNQGRPLATFRRALASLAAAGVRVERVSSAYLTRAAAAPGAPAGPAAAPFWNAACLVRAEGSAWHLLSTCQRLEAAAGRRRRPGVLARPLDLDLLAFGDLVSRHPRLFLPHPRLAQRPFVLWPLCEVAADLPLPGGTTPRRLLAALAEPLFGIALVHRGWGAADLDCSRGSAYTWARRQVSCAMVPEELEQCRK